MSSGLDNYLAELRAQLGDVDPALAQDALYDADEHLRTELAERRRQHPSEEPDASLAAVIERYGSAAEVATAYREAEKAEVSSPEAAPAVPAAASWIDRVFGVVWDGRTWLAFAYLLLAFGTGIGYFTIVVTGLALSAGFAVFVFGIPFVLGFLGVVRALSLLEGRLVEFLLGVRMPKRAPLGPKERGIVGRVLFWLKDRRTWTTLLYMTMQLPLGITYFVSTVTSISVGAWLVSVPVIQSITGRTYVQVGAGRELLFDSWTFPFLVVGGLALLLATLHIVRLVGRLHGAYAKALLVLWSRPADAPGPGGGLITKPVS